MNLHISEAWAALKEFMSPAKATVICTHCGEDLVWKSPFEQRQHLAEHREGKHEEDIYQPETPPIPQRKAKPKPKRAKNKKRK